MTVKAVRAMKARKSSTLGCGCYVFVGALIVSRGDGWHCLPCYLERIRIGQPCDQGLPQDSLIVTPMV